MRKFEVVCDTLRKYPLVGIVLPVRKTKFSAGYDFHLPCDAEIQPGKSFAVHTDVKAAMNEDEVLEIYIRSSFGIKFGLRIKNVVGIIDKDYYENPSNDGNIIVCLVNESDEIVILNKGDAFAQGIFRKFLTTDDDAANGDRIGGIGSTSK